MPRSVGTVPPFVMGGGTVQATLGGRVTQFLAKLEFSFPATPLNLQKSDGPSGATEAEAVGGLKDRGGSATRKVNRDI